MIDPSLAGLAGMTMLMLAWIPQTVETIRSRHSGLEWQFDVLYAGGALFLAWYSLALNNLVFTLLNCLSAYMALIGLYYKAAELLGKRGKPKKARAGRR